MKFILVLFTSLFLQVYLVSTADMTDIGLFDDPSPYEVNGEMKPGSHIKLFLPNLPYLAISHAVNASLVRPSENQKGWQYDLAVSHKSIGDQIWEFRLRRGVKFHDGSLFNADSVLLNMEYFMQQPFTFSKLSSILEKVEKTDDYGIRFYLSEPYGVFLHDAIWLQFYTTEYLQKFGWNGKPTCPNLAEPGLYGLGPYILQEGYVEGDRSSPTVILTANPNYWGAEKPKVETITILTELKFEDAKDSVLSREGEIDITPVPFEDEVEVILSPYAKLTVSPSLNNYAMHFNMINGSKAMNDDRIRFAINHAIDQESLLNLTMLGEGTLSPTMVSPNFYRVEDAIATLDTFFNQTRSNNNTSIEYLKRLVHSYQIEQNLDPNFPLELTLLAQESFLFLIRDFQFFLSQINIDLKTIILPTEKLVFQQLLTTWENNNDLKWDLLLWGNFDWYKHPWAAFFVYRPFYAWSTIPLNTELTELTDQLLRLNVESDEYIPFLAKFIKYQYEKNYMVFLPTPNNIYAVNKEVVFKPGRSAMLYLREIEVTDLHWSLRDDIEYPVIRRRPLKVNRLGKTLYER